MDNLNKIILDGPNDEAVKRLSAWIKMSEEQERQKKQECKKQKRAETESNAK